MARSDLGRVKPRRLNAVVSVVVCFALASSVFRLSLLTSTSIADPFGDSADALLLPQSSATNGTRPRLVNAINETGRISDPAPRFANSLNETGQRVDPLQAPSDYPFLVPSDFAPLSTDDPPTILYADAEGSARALLKEAQTPRSIPDDVIDPAIEQVRCKRYNLKYSGRTERRRIFYGSTIADDSWHIVSITAMENYGIFHSVSLVESNRTHMNNPRDLRFGPGSENLTVLQNGLWGPNVPVTVDLFLNEPGAHQPGWHPAGYGMEGLMRGHIIKRWKQNGMTVDDIGYLADMDEFYTRDYLRAMQICDVKELDAHENCKRARLGATTHIFEGGPECKSSKMISHPDLTIGACILGINNSTLHVKPERGWRGTGWLSDGWSPASRYRKVPKNATHYPLFNAPDFRRMFGKSYAAKGFRYNAFHLHNFFADINVLRNKYSTYGEIVAGAWEKPLGSIHGDLNVMVVCGLNVSDPVYEKKERWAGGLETLKGPIPLAFQIPGYVEGKMAELKEMLLLDGNAEAVSASTSIDPKPDSNVSTIFWLHIQKTGTSLFNTIFLHFCPRVVKDPNFLGFSKPKQLMDTHLLQRHPPEQFCDNVTFVNRHAAHGPGGHHPYSAGEEGGEEYHYFTMFRDPMERLRSAFSFRNNPQGTPHLSRLRNGSISFDTYVNESHIPNCQLKMVLGYKCNSSVDPGRLNTTLAVERVRTPRFFFGITDRWDESICLFHSWYGGMTQGYELRNNRPTKRMDLSGLPSYEFAETDFYREVVKIFDGRLERAGCKTGR